MPETVESRQAGVDSLERQGALYGRTGLSIDQAAQYLAVDYDTIGRLIEQGALLAERGDSPGDGSPTDLLPSWQFLKDKRAPLPGWSEIAPVLAKRGSAGDALTWLTAYSAEINTTPLKWLLEGRDYRHLVSILYDDVEVPSPE